MSKSFFKLKLLLLFSIVVLSLITVTYAHFFAIDRQDDDNTIASTCFSVDFTDGQSINMSGALPMDDISGMYQMPYEFSLTNNCTYDMSYQVVTMVPATSIDNQYIKFMFSGFKIGKVNEQESGKEIDGFQIPKIIGTGTVRARTTITEEIRFWLDEETPIEQVKNKSWNAQIKIISSVKDAS